MTCMSRRFCLWPMDRLYMLKMCLARPCVGPLKHRQLSRCLASRPKILAALLALTTCLILVVYFQVSRWLTSKFVCRQELYPFITDYNHIDLQLEYFKRRSPNEANTKFGLTQVSSLQRHTSASPDIQKRQPTRGCRKLSDSGSLVSTKHNGSDECPPCPRLPPDLDLHLGLSDLVHINTTAVGKDQLVVKYPDIERGGRLRPMDCQPQQRLAVIIPYRSRLSHLHILLNNLVPFCASQQADVTFIIIEQDESAIFNRGALLNIGFLEADKLGRFDCFIFHDVDLLPLSSRNLYRCGDTPRHLAVALNKYDYNLLYPGYFGGVVGFTREQYLDVNGNSNLYFGWGGEDDDLLLRSVSKGYSISRYTHETSRYDMIIHDRDKGNEVNAYRNAILRSATLRQDVEGLSSIKYQVIYKKFEHLYTWITVSLSATEIWKTAPDYTLKDVADVDSGTSTSQTLTNLWLCLLPSVISWRVLDQSSQGELTTWAMTILTMINYMR